MACGVPVVASRVGGIPEVIEDTVSGFLHPPEDIDAMAKSAVTVLSDPQLHRAVAAAARLRVHERFSASQIVSIYEACYEEVLQSETQ